MHIMLARLSHAAFLTTRRDAPTRLKVYFLRVPRDLLSDIPAYVRDIDDRTKKEKPKEYESRNNAAEDIEETRLNSRHAQDERKYAAPIY